MAFPVTALITEIILKPKQEYKSGYYWGIKTQLYKGEVAEYTLQVPKGVDYTPTVGHVVTGWPDRADDKKVKLSQVYDGASRDVILEDTGKGAVTANEKYWPGSIEGSPSPAKASSGGTTRVKSGPAADKEGSVVAPYASQQDGVFVWSGLKRTEILEKERQLRIQGNMSNATKLYVACMENNREAEFEAIMARVNAAAKLYATGEAEYTTPLPEPTDSRQQDTGGDLLKDDDPFA